MPAPLENLVKFIITVGVGVFLGTHVCGTVNNFVFGVCVWEGFLYSPGCPEASYIDQDDLTFQGLCHHPQPVGSFGRVHFLFPCLRGFWRLDSNCFYC